MVDNATPFPALVVAVLGVLVRVCDWHWVWVCGWGPACLLLAVVGDVVLLPPLLALELVAGLGASTPPKGPPAGDTALPALRASDTYASSVRPPTSAGLITATMPFLQCCPVFWEQYMGMALVWLTVTRKTWAW